MHNIHANVLPCNESNIPVCCKFTQLHSRQILLKSVNIWLSYCEKQKGELFLKHSVLLLLLRQLLLCRASYMVCGYWVLSVAASSSWLLCTRYCHYLARLWVDFPNYKDNKDHWGTGLIRGHNRMTHRMTRTTFWKRMNRFWCQLAQLVHSVRASNINFGVRRWKLKVRRGWV